MRFRVLLTDGRTTSDLIWLKHTGSDVYFGYVGATNKYTYHGSGKRHQKFDDGRIIHQENHLPLKQFTGHIELCGFGFLPQAKGKKAFKGKKSDATLYLDSRSLPEYVNMRLGLVEPGKLGELYVLKDAEVLDLWNVLLMTASNPWVYVLVQSLKPEIRKMAEKLSNKSM